MGNTCSPTLLMVLICSVTRGTMVRTGLIGPTGRTLLPSIRLFLTVRTNSGMDVILWSSVRALLSLRHVTVFTFSPVDWSQAALSTSAVVHADYGYSGHPRRVPQFLARGPFNQWGFDQGLPNLMTQNEDGKWELEIMASWPTYVQLNGKCFTLAQTR